MQYKAKDIGPEGRDVNVPVTDAWLAAEVGGLEARTAPSGLALRGRLEKSGEDFLLRGHLRGGLVTSCARCLEPATLALDVPVTVCFVEKPEAADEDEEEDDNVEAPDVLQFEDGVIDLADELREEVLLALPQSTLCREDCAGLCSVCGGNRNASPCDCEEKQRIASSKLSTLGKLKI